MLHVNVGWQKVLRRSRKSWCEVVRTCYKSPAQHCACILPRFAHDFHTQSKAFACERLPTSADAEISIDWRERIQRVRGWRGALHRPTNAPGGTPKEVLVPLSTGADIIFYGNLPIRSTNAKKLWGRRVKTLPKIVPISL